MAFTINTQVRFRATFTNADRVAADPTAVTFQILSPAGVETLFTYGVDASLTKDPASTGRFTMLFTPDAAGSWFARWKGTGAVKAASSDILLIVEATRLTP